MKRSTIVPIAVCLLFAGCGGDDGAEDRANPSDRPTTTAAPSGPAPTRAEYIARADKLCKRTNARAKPVVRRLLRAKPDEELSLYPIADDYRELEQLYRGLVDDLLAIQAPPQRGAILDEYKRVLRRRALLASNMAAAAEEDHLSRYMAFFAKIVPIGVLSERLAKRYGFKECE